MGLGYVDPLDDLSPFHSNPKEIYRYVRACMIVVGKKSIIPNRKLKSSTTSTSTSTSTGYSLRRTMSSEDRHSIITRSSTPPLPPPKDPIPQRPPDDFAVLQLQNVRMNISSQDQEAMRKLRLDMSLSESVSGSNSSIGGLIPTKVNSSITSLGHEQRPPLGSRRSTLSRQITSEDLDDPIHSVS